MKSLGTAIMLVSGVAAAQPAITTTTTTTTVVTIEPSAIEPPLAPPSLTPIRTPADASEPRPPRDRAFAVSAAIGPGLGFDTKDKCGAGECATVHLAIGGAIGRHLLLLLGASIMSPVDHKYSHLNTTHHVETLALRYSPTARIWAELGIGVGNKRSWVYDTAPQMNLNGLDPAGTVGVGYEALVRDG